MLSRKSSSTTFPSLLLFLATSILFLFSIQLLSNPTGLFLVLARPTEQLIELAGSRSIEDNEEIRYGLAETETEEENDGKTNAERQLSRDTFFSLDPDPEANERQRTTSDAERRQILRARHWGQQKRHRNRNRGQDQRQEEVEERIGADGSREQEEERLGLHDGQPLLTLTSADIVNTTLQANTCRGDLFKHKVRVAGCRPKTITNRFCHGSCSSFYIPRLRSKKLKATFQSCAACVPSETDLVQVRLDCPDREEGHLYRTVVRVKKCACRNIVLEGEEENDGDEPATVPEASIVDDDGTINGNEEDSGDGTFAAED